MEAIVEFITSMPTGRFISAVIVLLLLAGLGLALHIFAKRMSDAIIVKDVLKEAKAREPKSTSAKAKIKMTPKAEGKPQSQKIEQMSIDAIFAKKPPDHYANTVRRSIHLVQQIVVYAGNICLNKMKDVKDSCFVKTAENV